ncbi:MAG: hypothetical protein IT186_01340 [Acidobacteria bacterium]|nr:hypothetical protein [Acidobacteriota bacterium]
MAVTHHTTAILVAGPLSLLLLLVFWRRSHTAGREAITVAACASLPVAASVGLVSWRAFHPARWQWPTLAPAWQSVEDHLLATRFRPNFGSFAPGPEQQVYLASYVYPYLAVFLALTVGAVVLSRHRKQSTVISGLASVALLGTVFAFLYGVPDPSSYFLLPMAFASTSLVSLGGLLAARGPRFRYGTAIATGVTVVLTLRLATNWMSTARQRRAMFVSWDADIRAMWDAIPFDQAIVLWSSDISTKLVERQLLFGEKPGIDVVNPNLLGHDYPRMKFIERHGFDPVAFHRPEQGTRQEFIELTTRRIAEASPLPVIDFRPEERSVRLLRKP